MEIHNSFVTLSLYMYIHYIEYSFTSYFLLTLNPRPYTYIYIYMHIHRCVYVYIHICIHPDFLLTLPESHGREEVQSTPFAVCAHLSLGCHLSYWGLVVNMGLCRDYIPLFHTNNQGHFHSHLVAGMCESQRFRKLFQNAAATQPMLQWIALKTSAVAEICRNCFVSRGYNMGKSS